MDEPASTPATTGFVAPGAGDAPRVLAPHTDVHELEFLPPPPPPPTPPRPRTRTLAAALGAVITLGILASIGVALFASKGDRAHSPEATGATGSSVSPVLDRSSGSDSVDPAEAQRVARALWQAEMQGMHDHSVEAIKTVTSGPMLQVDLGYLREYSNGCTGRCWHAPLRTIDSISVNVPHQTGWPATFLAAVRYTSACDAQYMPCVDLFVARQADEGAPWTMHLFVSYGGHMLGEDPDLLEDGYARTPTLGVPPDATLLDDYAKYREAVKRTGQPPTDGRFLPGPFTSELASQILVPDGQKTLGIREDTTYRGDPDSGMFAFATSAHTTTTCGVIRYSGDDVALPGRTIDSDLARYIGASVPRGKYTSIHVDGLHQVCFETYPSDAAMPEQVVATYGTSTVAVGTHA